MYNYIPLPSWASLPPPLLSFFNKAVDLKKKLNYLIISMVCCFIYLGVLNIH